MGVFFVFFFFLVRGKGEGEESVSSVFFFRLCFVNTTTTFDTHGIVYVCFFGGVLPCTDILVRLCDRKQRSVYCLLLCFFILILFFIIDFIFYFFIDFIFFFFTNYSSTDGYHRLSWLRSPNWSITRASTEPIDLD